MQFAQAVGAHRRVGGDRRVGHLAVRALPDREPALTARGARLAHHLLDDCERWRLGAQPGQERVDRDVGPLDLGDDPVRVVEHEPAQLQLPGQPVDVGAKAHALDRAPDADVDPGATLPRRRVHAHPTSARSAW